MIGRQHRVEVDQVSPERNVVKASAVDPFFENDEAVRKGLVPSWPSRLVILDVEGRKSLQRFYQLIQGRARSCQISGLLSGVLPAFDLHASKHAQHSANKNPEKSEPIARRDAFNPAGHSIVKANDDTAGPTHEEFSSTVFPSHNVPIAHASADGKVLA